jgi:transcriptional regulator with XRE-family HTH domain
VHCIEVAKKTTAIGLVALSSATGSGIAAGVNGEPWTGGSGQPQVAYTLKVTSGPLRFEDAISGKAVIVGLDPSSIASADNIRLIYEKSGLTWEQIARLFGVSRRAVHSWAAGSRVSSRHLEAILDLSGRLSRRPGSPDENRTWLLDSAMGPSIFEQIRAGSARSAMQARVPVTELMGLR